MYYSQHIDTAILLISKYNKQQPLHVYLKTYFRQNKKHGSKDRKQIAALCYNYFRLGFAFKNALPEQRMLIGMFLCEHAHSELLNFVKPGWDVAINRPLEEKLAIENWQPEIDTIFPFKEELSTGIDATKFEVSFLQQPKVFLRIRPGFEKVVLQKIQAGKLLYEKVSRNCVALSNSSKIESVALDKEAVVQDYSSQRIGDFIQLANNGGKPVIDVWDCCAASGGKSIMAWDILPGIQLTVSDKRKSILQNLQERFRSAGINKYTSFVADLSGNQAGAPARATFSDPGSPIFPALNEAHKNEMNLNKQNYDLILADVPCTGSGTWSRTPEQLYYFHKKEIKEYSDLQKQIVSNAIPYLKQGAGFLYSTCSVFKEENEEVARFIMDKFKMDIIKMELLKGYERQADTMFAVLFGNYNGLNT